MTQTPWPVQLRLVGGRVALNGHALGQPPTTPYVPPTAKEVITGHVVSIANGASALLDWTNDHQGDTVLDFTAPTLPKIIAAGVYAITANVSCASDLTAGGYFTAVLQAGQPIGPYYRLAGGDSALPLVCRTLVTHLNAGETVEVGVTNNDGVSSRDFFLVNGSIQRIS